MKGKIKIRNGLFSKECDFVYNSGYVTHVNSTHEQTASYNKSNRNIEIDDHYTTSIKMNDFETRNEKKIYFPFNIDFNQGDMATIFYVKADKKGYERPIGIYNHENKEGYVNPNIKLFLGFRLLNAGKFKRAFAWILNIIEHLGAFGIVYLVSFMFTKDEIMSLFIALFLTKLVWYPVAFITNLFLPSNYGAKRACAKFEKEILRIGRKETEKSREIKQKLTEINDPMSRLRAAGIDMGSQTTPQRQDAPQIPSTQSNDGFKPMF